MENKSRALSMWICVGDSFLRLCSNAYAYTIAVAFYVLFFNIIFALLSSHWIGSRGYSFELELEPWLSVFISFLLYSFRSGSKIWGKREIYHQVAIYNFHICFLKCEKERRIIDKLFLENRSSIQSTTVPLCDNKKNTTHSYFGFLIRSSLLCAIHFWWKEGRKKKTSFQMTMYHIKLFSPKPSNIGNKHTTTITIFNLSFFWRPF